MDLPLLSMPVEMMKTLLDLFHSLLFVVLCIFAKIVAAGVTYMHIFSYLDSYKFYYVAPAKTQYIPLMPSWKAIKNIFASDM